MVDTKVYATFYKFYSFEPSHVICEDPSGYDTNLCMILCRNLTTDSCVMFTTGITSIHLVNVSILTNKNLNLPGALDKTPTISIPQIAKGQKRSKGQRGFTCFIVCF
jgi:hypothetical protein